MEHLIFDMIVTSEVLHLRFLFYVSYACAAGL
jgi:hypothetical protein